MWWSKKPNAAEVRAEHIRQQVRALVPARMAHEMMEKVLAGQLSLLDLKMGVYSLAERVKMQSMGTLTEKQLDRCTSPVMVDRVVREQVRDILDMVARDHFLALQQERKDWERCGRR